MKKVVLTGGPGTGKSSIILALESMGYHVIREAAEDYIRMRQAQGQPQPWTEQGFQEGILELQLQREARVHPDAEVVFIDRGVADGLAYAQPGTEIYKRLEEEAGKAKYDQIFLIEYLGRTEKTAVRREGEEEAIRLGQKLEQVYKELGHEAIKVAAGPLDERVKKVLEALK